MIHLKACFNKNIIKYAIILILLLIVIVVFLILLKSVNTEVAKEKRNIIYRTALIKFNDDIFLSTAINDSTIVEYDYDEESSEYSIVFYNTEDMKTFLKNYSSHIRSTASQDFAETNYAITKNVFNGIIIISIVLIIILFFIFLINFISSIEKDIALYKLLGYSESKIIVFLIVTMYLFYLLLYVISLIFSILLIKFFGSFVASLLKFSLVNLSIKEIILVFICGSVVFILSFIKSIIKINKISPIKLIRSVS